MLQIRITWGFCNVKEHLAIWIVGAMPLGPRVKEFSCYLFVLTQLATESFGGRVVLRHSSLLLSRKNMGKWREMGGEIILRATIRGTKIGREVNIQYVIQENTRKKTSGKAQRI